MGIYHVYILECNDKSYYVGFTNDLDRRLAEHNSGHYKNSYTYSRRPVVIKWSTIFNTPSAAMKVEKQIKGWSRKKKQALIENKIDALEIFSKNYTEFKDEIDDCFSKFNDN